MQASAGFVRSMARDVSSYKMAFSGIMWAKSRRLLLTPSPVHVKTTVDCGHGCSVRCRFLLIDWCGESLAISDEPYSHKCWGVPHPMFPGQIDIEEDMDA